MLKLFEKITMNHLVLNNRLVMPPINDCVTDKVCDYYRERAIYKNAHWTDNER